MSDEEKTYCRLCADLTPKVQLISPEEDVAITSKVATKLMWINIDITSSNLLPNTICFACFDSLERTWSFLHNVRTAQEKLTKILSPQVAPETEDGKTFDNPDAGKPIDANWDAFQELKAEVKVEKDEVIDSETLLKERYDVKAELRSDNEFQDAVDLDYALGFQSTDSDVPLVTVRAKKVKRKHKTKFKKKCSSEPIDVSTIATSWENLICRCGRCDAQCKNIPSLQLHSIHIHNQCCIFQCIDCSKKFLTYNLFVSHARTHIKDLEYCCEYCNYVFSRGSLLKEHRNKKHSCVYLTKCGNCGMCFDTQQQLRDHKMIFRKGLIRSKGKKKGEKMECEAAMVLKCEVCSKEFKSKSNLQQHKLVHSERSRDFSCHICGKMFFTKGTLGTHMMTHNESKPYKCEHCPLAFRARGNLQSHISRHTGTKPFVCELCGKSFRVKRHLKSHSIVHTDLMPFSCSFCSKTFKFKTRLNLHLRQHTGDKPYKCIYCRRDFTNGSNFKKHMKRRHGIDTSRQKYDNIVTDYKPCIETAAQT